MVVAGRGEGRGSWFNTEMRRKTQRQGDKISTNEKKRRGEKPVIQRNAG